ncbi:MAG: hypothetical protein ACYCPN_05625 [Thermoplasmata archaeon]
MAALSHPNGESFGLGADTEFETLGDWKIVLTDGLREFGPPKAWG